ncbi:MAG: hypothetical protein N2038_14525, partial [Geminicoccaceae bacterium]|nr:hypothetical protein [Geminicoccaceae bacterium]
GRSRSVAANVGPDGVRLRIGDKAFLLRGFDENEIRASREGDTDIRLGGGLAWTSIGREFLDSIEIEPDPRYLERLAEGWKLCGLELVALDGGR